MRYLIALSIFALSSCGVLGIPEGCEPETAEINAWVKADREGTRSAYQEFLAAYPNGCFANRANSQLSTIVRQGRLGRVAGASGGGSGGGSY